MEARRIGRCQPLLFTGAVDAHAIEKTLRRVFGRSEKIKPTVLRIDSFDSDHVVGAGSDQLDVASIAGNGINMTPAVAFAGPEEALAAVDPFNVAARDSRALPIDVAPRDVHPRFVFFDQHWTDLSCAHVAEHDGVGVLAAVELLNDDFFGVCGPLHARQIVVACIAWNFEPSRSTAAGVYYANARGGIHLTSFRIGKNCQNWIKS